MRKLVLIGLGIGIGWATNTFALPVGTVIFSDGPGTTGGGEFNAVTSGHGSFATFCLEYNEHIAYGTTYYYEISQAARYNGNGTVDPLSRATAWLYMQFRSDTLGNYGVQYDYAGTSADADDLQRAIWFLEGETGGVNNYYAQLATAQADSPASANDGFYGVGVLNLWGNADGTGARQDQLILLPQLTTNVPDGGATVSLLALGLGCVAFGVRRKH